MLSNAIACLFDPWFYEGFVGRAVPPKPTALERVFGVRDCRITVITLVRY